MTILLTQDIQVTLVPVRVDVSFLQFLEHHTTGLIDMGAIVVFALTQVLPHLWKKMGQFFLRHIQNAKLFDSRGIDEVS
jgi:hypothetical protein